VVEPSGLYYPNRVARYFMMAAEDMLSQSGLQAALSMSGLDRQFPPDNLDRSYDFANFAALSQALEEMYGARGGRGMALRIGREWFSHGMKSFGALAGLADPAFRTLPLDTRCSLGLEALTSIFRHYSDQHVTLEQDDEHFYWIVENCPTAWGRVSDKPVCHALVGLLQGCLSWATDGCEFHTYERVCAAVGSPKRQCIFSVHKKPIGS
jgi:predicted hydrocarbon binding protein